MKQYQHDELNLDDLLRDYFNKAEDVNSDDQLTDLIADLKMKLISITINVLKEN